MAPRFFVAEQKDLFPHGWGDYGSILQNGMSSHLERIDGQLALERTGPFIPPITFPGISEIVVTSEARTLLESAGLTGFGFFPVNKFHIVHLDWHLWDLSAEEPLETEEEPEDYILKHPHSEEAALALGEVWEIAVPETATVRRIPTQDKFFPEIRLELGSWNGADLVLARNYLAIIFSDRAREFFSSAWPNLVQFKPILLA
jgi:hypothetical protein